MKKIFSVIPLLTIAIFATCMSISAKQIKISKKNFPDSEVREVLKHDVDKNGDGILSEKEQKKKTSLFLDNVNNIKGISKLEYAEYVEVYHSTMTKIKNVKELYKMKSLNGISFVECNVGAFNPKKIKNLRKISYHSVKSKVKDFDFNNNKKIKKISLIATEVNSLKINGASNLTYLELVGAPQMESIDLSQFKKLRSLNLWNIPLKALDVTKNIYLESLSIGETEIKELDLRKNKKLDYLDVFENREGQSGEKINVLTYSVEINEENFPDDYIRPYILKVADSNQDGVLQVEEACKIESFEIDYLPDRELGNIERKTDTINLKGLDNFQNLKKLRIGVDTGMHLKNLKTIYNLPDIEELIIRERRQQGIKTLKLKQWNQLKVLKLQGLAIKKLDITKNKKLKTINIRYAKKLKRIISGKKQKVKQVSVYKCKKLNKDDVRKLQGK